MEPICTQVKVRVPATSANLGSGFDTVGLALDYHDELTFTLSRDPSNRAAQVLIYGEGEDTLPRSRRRAGSTAIPSSSWRPPSKAIPTTWRRRCTAA